VDQGDYTQQHVHPADLHSCCLKLGSWSLYSSGETVWNCRWLAAERCNLEGTIKSCNLLHAPATYKFVLLDIFGGVKVWEKKYGGSKTFFLLSAWEDLHSLIISHTWEICCNKKNVRFQVVTVVLLRIQVFFKMSGSCHPVTVSHPRRPKSSTQFSFCDNLYAYPHERLQPSGQTTNLTTRRHLVRSREEWTHLLCTCFLSACLCPLPPIFIGITGLILSGVIVFSFFLVLTDSSSALWARGGTGDWWLATSQPELILSPCQLQHEHCFIYKRPCCLLHLEVQIV